MTGIKGRSGKTRDPQARRLRQLAGQKGGRANGAGPDPINSERLPPEGEGWESLLPGRNPYDEIVRKTKGRFSYLDAKAREQSNGELLANDRRKHELDEARGKVIPRSELDRAIKKIRDAWWREVQQVAGLVLPRLADLPGDARARVKSAIDTEVAAAADRVKASMA